MTRHWTRRCAYFAAPYDLLPSAAVSAPGDSGPVSLPIGAGNVLSMPSLEGQTLIYASFVASTTLATPWAATLSRCIIGAGETYSFQARWTDLIDKGLATAIFTVTDETGMPEFELNVSRLGFRVHWGRGEQGRAVRSEWVLPSSPLDLPEPRKRNNHGENFCQHPSRTGRERTP